jgi:hypothetical protein
MNIPAITVETLTETILHKMPQVGKVQTRFFVRLLTQWLSLRGRYCFANLVRQGFLNPLSYRLNFAKPFDFATFNRLLITRYAGTERVLAFDPCFLSKAGKHTPGVGYFWSGCAQAVKRGLEMACLAVLDVTNHTAFHYQATQTRLAQGQTLLGFYTQLLVGQADQLRLVASHLAVDAFFAKHEFVTALQQKGIHVITRLRSDAALWYLYAGPKSAKAGRPRKYVGKADVGQPDLAHLACFEQSPTHAAYQGVLYSKSLKTALKVVLVHHLNADGSIRSVQIMACTDTALSGQRLWHYYRLRFQQEFLFRDGKQHLGMGQCQSRHAGRIGFQVNFALSVLSIVKVVHWLSVPLAERKAFSIQDIKTRYGNQHWLDQLITGMGLCSKTIRNSSAYQQLLNYAIINP